MHWSYELLVRLDFLQAALENAPQCVIQLYALLTEPEEDTSLAIVTLFFSFLDFVRVSICVQWDIHKGTFRTYGTYGSCINYKLTKHEDNLILTNRAGSGTGRMLWKIHLEANQRTLMGFSVVRSFRIFKALTTIRFNEIESYFF